MRKHAPLTEGARYRVTEPGASLIRDVSTGPSSWRSERHDLGVGDVLIYRGKTGGVGHDNVAQDTFEIGTGDDSIIGKFRPDFWGRANRRYLEPADAGGEDGE